MDFLLTVLTTSKHINILRNLGASAEAQGPPISCLQGLEDHKRPAVKSKHQATGLVAIQSKVTTWLLSYKQRERYSF